MSSGGEVAEGLVAVRSPVCGTFVLRLVARANASKYKE
ncbi:hypothetical protein EKH55_1995 [Sinorhizobium alkalisoli]|nr:hypothetical protein EKH55_1995 [Sinorhizobium alkalisoli]